MIPWYNRCLMTTDDATTTRAAKLTSAEHSPCKREDVGSRHCVVSGCTGGRARRNGRIIRYNERSGEFGCLSTEGYIITFFVPVPLQDHPYTTNLEYFKDSCSH